MITNEQKADMLGLARAYLGIPAFWYGYYGGIWGKFIVFANGIMGFG